jgi:hypothetical protein
MGAHLENGGSELFDGRQERASEMRSDVCWKQTNADTGDSAISVSIITHDPQRENRHALEMGAMHLENGGSRSTLILRTMVRTGLMIGGAAGIARHSQPARFPIQFMSESFEAWFQEKHYYWHVY